MCGIAGIFNLDLSPLGEIPYEEIDQALASRGPDDRGHFQDGPVSLIHRRLSILDLSARAKQPLKSPCGRVVLTFNGEIYNFQILRKELESRGVVFRTTSDSEVLAAALAEWEVEALQRLDGMFAFAAWFPQKKKLLLARDRTGIKPLVYQKKGNQFSFASTITALKPLWKEKPRLNRRGLQHYLTFGHVSDSETLLEGVERLPAAHYLWLGDESSTCYWQPHLNREPNPLGVEERIRELMSASIAGHALSERPMGLMLSGGLDSSILAALLKEEKPDFKAFTLHYPFQESFESNEIDYARRVAGHLDIPVEKVEVTEESIYQNFEKVGHLMDEPNAGPALLPYYCAYEQLKDQVTVVIDGGGADEVFAGYRKYLVARAWDQSKSWPLSIRKLLAGLGVFGQSGSRWFDLPDDTARIIDPQMMWGANELKVLLGEEFQENWLDEKNIQETLDLPLASRMQFFDLKNHMIGWGNSLLDRVSMAHGLECRVPYQSTPLIEYVLGLPESFRIRWPREKRLLKEVFSDQVPRPILKRRKQGLVSPLKHFLRFGLKEAMCDLLSSERLKKQGIFNAKIVEKQIQETLDVSANHTPRLWPLIQFQLWCEEL